MNIDNQYKTTPANKIKCITIDYLINTYNNITIGNEIMYGTYRKVVDLLMIYNNHTYAIEIKSEKDNINRLESQINEYSKIFDYIIIICTEKHYEKIETIITKNIGVIIVKKNLLSKKRKATLCKKKDKKEILFTIPAQYLNKVTNLNYSADILIQTISKRSIKKINEIFYSYLLNKLTNSYNNFLSQKGKYTIEEDLDLLTKEMIID